MIHNPEHRMAKMMREIRAFDECAELAQSSWLARRVLRNKAVFFIRAAAWPRRSDVFSRSQKPERCVRQALKQVRKIMGKK